MNPWTSPAERRRESDAAERRKAEEDIDNAEMARWRPVLEHLAGLRLARGATVHFRWDSDRHTPEPVISRNGRELSRECAKEYQQAWKLLDEAKGGANVVRCGVCHAPFVQGEDRATWRTLDRRNPQPICPECWQKADAQAVEQARDELDMDKAVVALAGQEEMFK